MGKRISKSGGVSTSNGSGKVPCRRSSDYSLDADEQAAGRQSALFPEAARRMLNELQLQQTQMEMLNEELRRTQAAMEASQARYFNFYNMAPVGYLTITRQGLIVEANLTIANLFGVTRDSLVRQTLILFILPEDRDRYSLFIKQLFALGTARACELRMVKRSGGHFWVRVEAALVSCADDETQCNAVVIDISERKLAEESQ